MQNNVYEAIGQVGNVSILNVTAHPLNFLVDGEIVQVPPSGWIVNAETITLPGKMPAAYLGAAEGRKQMYRAETRELNNLKQFYSDTGGGVVVVGSIIAAQAYPDYIVSPIMLAGHERTDRLADPTKFQAFERELHPQERPEYWGGMPDFSR